MSPYIERPELWLWPSLCIRFIAVTAVTICLCCGCKNLCMLKKTCVVAIGLLLPLMACLKSEGVTQTRPGVENAPGEIKALLSNDRSKALNSEQAGMRDALTFFYETADFLPAWSVNESLNKRAVTMLSVFTHASEVGLNPNDYCAPILSDCSFPPHLTVTSSMAARIDVALTTAAIRYFTDLRYGVANPIFKSAPSDRHQVLFESATFLRNLILSNEDPVQAMDRLEPPFHGYQRTKVALKEYLSRQQKEDTEATMPLPTHDIHPGEEYSNLPALLARLKLLGDLDQSYNVDTRMYDDKAVAAVRAFQSRSGLANTGTLDKQTTAALATPISTRIMQLRLALERWRWVRHDVLPAIVVNIPEFRLRAFDEDHSLRITMPVIVGRAYRHKTPIFEDKLQSITVRPYWNVPTSILKNEIVPAIKRDPNYLIKHHFEVVMPAGSAADRQSSAPINLLAAGKARIRQIPGDTNALGLLKFEFPNRYSIYLHGTPEQHLFSKMRRDFSHGCIRVEDPVSLALWALQGDSRWDRSQLSAAMNGDRTISIPVPRQITLLIVYTTAVVEEDNRVLFSNDIYGYDASLIEELMLVSSRENQEWAPWLNP